MLRRMVEELIVLPLQLIQDEKKKERHTREAKRPEDGRFVD
jgi:hypothetical protein